MTSPKLLGIKLFLYLKYKITVSNFADSRGKAPATHSQREEHHALLLQPLRCQALQNIQGLTVPLHADGAVPRWRALDHPQGQEEV